jgi:hypothetical protein
MICAAFVLSEPTIAELRRAYTEGALDAVLVNRKKPDRVYERRMDGEAEAQLVALVCGDPSDGHECWTLRLLKIE